MASRRQFLGGARDEIASAVVYSLPGRRDALRAALRGRPGVDIHGETEDGRFVVTVEGANGESTGDILLSLHNLPDASATALVAHYEVQ